MSMYPPGEATTEPRLAVRRRAGMSRASRRNWWIRQVRSWHWVSAALSLGIMFFFAATGITLNHAASIPATPVVSERHASLPPAARRVLASVGTPTGETSLPPVVAAAVKKAVRLDPAGKPVEWSADEAYVALPRAGGDAWVSIHRKTGMITAEVTSRGVISWANDLHKGRNTGALWFWFIDIFAGACIVFTLSGLLLLQIHSGYRRLTWPVIAAGLLLPALLLVVH